MNAVIDLKDVILETDRLILREWQESDLNDFFEYASVDGVGQMAGWQPHKNIEESKFVLDMFIREGKTFAVVLKENNKAIGSVGIEKLSTEIDGYENMNTDINDFKKTIKASKYFVLSKDEKNFWYMPGFEILGIDFKDIDEAACIQSAADLYSFN